jgi:type VI secretion system protein VasD
MSAASVGQAGGFELSSKLSAVSIRLPRVTVFGTGLGKAKLALRIRALVVNGKLDTIGVEALTSYFASVFGKVIGRRALLLTLPIAACGGPPPPPPPPQVDLTIKAAKDENPDPSGQATPVTMRLLQLSGTGAFDSADALSLASSPTKVLGDSLLGSEDMIITPGETRSVTIAPKPGAQFLAVAVLFRNIDQAHWRASAPIAPHGPTRLVLTITGLTTKLAPA